MVVDTGLIQMLHDSLRSMVLSSADFDGCMYGLVSLHGKNAGLPIKKPWRVAYLNSNLGDFLNSKCDGSHDHSSCSGQNTSVTECYTPLIAKAVHQCFRRDTRLHGVDSSDDANSIMPAATCVLKLSPSDAHARWANLLMAGQPPKPDESWPRPKEAAQQPQLKGWRKNANDVAEKRNLSDVLDPVLPDESGQRPKGR